MTDFVPITIARGDGIGPEIMDVVIQILKEAEAEIRIETIEIGEKLYKKNYTSGIAEDAWNSLARTKLLLKAPITTPQGGGYKSLNVTLRKALGLYANIRPSISYYPFVKTLHPKLDLTIIRENEEDLYAGIEYRQTHNMYESLKLISQVGSEKIIRYAFKYAIDNNRKKVTCFSKDNIMKFTDGIFHKVFDAVAKEFSQIKSEHYIIDIGTAKLATAPELFDVIVTSNLYGDIISDVAAEISGSVGLAGSANIGQGCAMFEAVHGSAPDIADKNVANPSGLINAAIMMLVHIGQGKKATIIENAWKRTIEDGIHTSDIFDEKHSSKKVSTKDFGTEIIKRLGQVPAKLSSTKYVDKVNTDHNTQDIIFNINSSETKTLVGTDIFIHMNVNSAHEVANKIQPIELEHFKLSTISAKGLKLWPRDEKYELLSDHWCCRFIAKNEAEKIDHNKVAQLISSLAGNQIDFIKVENLFEFDGKKGFSLSQGE